MILKKRILFMDIKSIEYKKKFNRQLYPVYKMFSWDLLFHSAIIFIYLTTVKELSIAEVFLLDACYTGFKCIMQFPAVIIVDRLGKKKSLVFANSLVSMYVLLLILPSNFIILVAANFIEAIGFVIKGLSESNLLYDCTPQSEYRSKHFNRLDSKGASFFYALDAVGCLATGFLYTINPYIPMYICLSFCYLYF